ncbi:MAG: polysaccharide deacetylase family protein [Rhodospirillales bacterium]
MASASPEKEDPDPQSRGSGKSAILMYHSLDTSGSVISIAPEMFRRHMEYLAQSGRPVVPLAEVTKTPQAVALTFDDGFLNFLVHALPPLMKYRFPATVFAISGCCGKRNDWNSYGKYVPSLQIMGWSEMREVAGSGISLGAHTVTHRKLTELAEEVIQREMRDCRMEIEDRTGSPVKAFSYPYGVSNAGIREMAAREFLLACGTRLQYVDGAEDILNLPRFDACYLRNLWPLRNLLTRRGSVWFGARRLARAARTSLPG